LRVALDQASGLIIGFKNSGGDVLALVDAPINGKPRVAGSSLELPDGEQVITAGSKTFGDSVIVVLDTVGGKISALERDNPRTASALSFTLGLLVSGPVGAVGDVVVGKAVEAELARNKAARDGLTAVVNEVGLRATTALSSTTLENDRESAEFFKFETENNVLKAGATVLGIGTIAKLLRRTGDIIPGGGINPNAGDGPKVDLPDGPASSAANAARLKEQLLQADFFTSAGKGLDDVRAVARAAGAGRSSTSGIALVEITGFPDGTVLKASSGVNKATGDLIGRGSENFKFDTLPNVDGLGIPRNTDVEYKVLDNLADQLGSNVNASGKVTIIIDNPRVCGSCQSVISQFEARYKNIKVEVIKRPKPPTPIALPPKGR
jgi:The  BURPS668_1122 family of deaminases